MKYIIAFCIIILTFIAFLVTYDHSRDYETSYIITVPKICSLNEVVAGEDYVFVCPN